MPKFKKKIKVNNEQSEFLSQILKKSGLIDILRRHTLMRRLILLLFLLVLIPIVVCIAVYINNITHENEQKADKIAASYFLQSSRNVSETIDNLVLKFDDVFKKTIDEKQKAGIKFVSSKVEENIKNDLENEFFTNKEYVADAVAIMESTPSGGLKYGEYIHSIPNEKEVLDKEQLENAIRKVNEVNKGELISIVFSRDNVEYITFAKSINRTGYSVIAVREELFSRVFESIEGLKNAGMILTNINGVVLARNSSMKEKVKIDDLFDNKDIIAKMKQLIEKKDKETAISINNESELTILNKANTHGMNFFLVGMLPYDVLHQQNSNTFFVVFLGIFMISALLYATIIKVSVSEPLKDISCITDNLKDGDFSSKAREYGVDEISEVEKNINDMTGIFKQKILSLSKNSELVVKMTKVANDYLVNDNFKNIIIQIDGVASMTNKQVLELDEAALDLSKMIFDVKNFKEMIEKLSMTVNRTKKLEKNVNENIVELGESSRKTKRVSNDVLSGVMKVNSAMKNISKISGVISGIAEQTKMLSLNASIEASKAGEHGKGFVVVADEVSNLARKSKEVSESIGPVIQDIQRSMELVINIVNSAEDTAREQAKMAEKAGKNSEKSVEMIHQIKQYSDKLMEIGGNIFVNTEDVTGMIEDVSIIAKENEGIITSISNKVKENIFNKKRKEDMSKIEELNRKMDRELKKFKFD